MYHSKSIFYALVAILISSILLTSSSITINSHQAFARCPNGTHKSPSGDCEAIVSNKGLPRCPNCFHRSPSGDCEQFASQSDNTDTGSSSSQISTTNGGQNDNSA